MKKIFRFASLGLMLSLSLTACKKGYIDPISKVDSGPDGAAPTITVISPATATVVIPFTDTKTNLSFQFSASDDIELKNIDIALNGVKLASFNSYIDYRSYKGSYAYNDLALGNHTFSVIATDLSGKSTTKEFPFTVTNKYQPIFASESFFVPFDYPSTDPLKIPSDIILNTPAIANSTSSLTGINGKGMQGGGVNYITYTKPNSWINDAKSFTVSFWFKLNGQTKNNNGGNGPEYIFSIPSTNGHWSGGQSMLFFETNSTGTQIKMPVVAADMTDTWFVWEGGNAIPGIADNTWRHCAMVYDAGTSKMSLYMNGVANAVQATWANHGNINFNPATAQEFRIGAGPKDVNNLAADDWLRSTWKGGLDQFRLFSGALTASQVKSIFDAKY
ncbi:MAG TPA: hypothetical protein PK191_00635 [Niabella sp.]|nr:hypothetical protein [Niabella sp.]HOZ98228.1 hypothetical protein [Niabella sp.]HQW13212.1 hypothetical protein [Niabella sp.]HQX18748.1 hypothetical protein [Niabella sp.]HQX41137.1 hypothetical protein [Niabella sp.]